MPIEIRATQPAVCIRRAAFESAGLNRAGLDARFGLVDDEFQLERDLIVIGPLFGDTVWRLVADLEQAALKYVDDYFEPSGKNEHNSVIRCDDSASVGYSVRILSLL